MFYERGSFIVNHFNIKHINISTIYFVASSLSDLSK